MSSKLTRELALPLADVKRIIDCAWFELTASLHGNLTYELDAALTLEMNDERAHRARGRGFSTRSWQPAYRASIEYAAKLFILQWIYKAPESCDMDQLTGLRDAVVKCWGIAGKMRKILAMYPDSTLMQRFKERTLESRYVFGKPILRGGKIDQVPTIQGKGATQSILLARCEYAALFQDSDNEGHTLSLESPLFMALDYSKDIADNA